MKERFKLKFDETSYLICYKWYNPNNKTPRGTIQIAHGLSEHVTRYDDFANFLVEAGYIVIGADHYNHGESASTLEQLGIIEKYDFIEAVVKSIKLVREEFKDLFTENRCLFAHSMGSIATQTYIQSYPNDFDKVILSGTDIGNFKYILLKLLTSLTVKKNDFKTSSKLVYNLTFGGFQKKFKEKSKFNWLSKNETNILEYEKDPLCGSSVSDSTYKSISIALRKSYKLKNIQKINPKLKIFILSGSEDPVSAMGKSVVSLYKKYLKASLDVKMKLYDGLRHEVLNEVKKQTVYQDIILFLK